MRVYDETSTSLGEFIDTAYDKMSLLADNLGPLLALADGMTPFSSRAALVEAWTNTSTRLEGTVYYAAGLLYQCKLGATSIADLPDMVPYEFITPQHFGGVTGAHVQAAWSYMIVSGGTAATATAPALTALPFMLPAGDYNKAGLPITLATEGFGWVIKGRGRISRLLNITIRVQDSAIDIQDLSLDEGAKGVNGIEFSPRGTNIRRGVVSNVHIRDSRDALFSEGDVAWLRFEKVFAEQNVKGHRFNRVIGFNLTDCQFFQNDEEGGVVYRGGEYRAVGCRFNNNGKAGLRLDGSTATGLAESVVENYLQGCSISNNYTGVASAGLVNRATWAITGAASNGAGGTRLTLNVAGGRHNLAEGIGKCNVAGTLTYNGDHVVTNVTDTTVDIPVAFLTSQTGTLRRPEWDLEIIGDDALRDTQANDIFIADCNINFTYIKDAFGVRFDGGRQKVQVFLDGNCQNISRVANGRGRLNDTTGGDAGESVSGSWSPVGITGQNYGFVEMISNVKTGWTDFGGMLWRQPKPGVAMIGNTPAEYFEIRSDEDSGISIKGLGSVTGDAFLGTKTLAEGGVIEVIDSGGQIITKFADGRMTIESAVINADVTTAQLQGFRSAIQSWVMPAAFRDTSYTVSINIVGNSQSHWAAGRPLTTNTIEFSMFAFASVAARGVRIKAEGRM